MDKGYCGPNEVLERDLPAPFGTHVELENQGLRFRWSLSCIVWCNIVIYVRLFLENDLRKHKSNSKIAFYIMKIGLVTVKRTFK